MKASELRIGNIVVASFSTGDYTLHTVTAGDFGKSAAGTLVCESFQPEKLTEEWLVRLGFQKRDDGIFSAQYGIDQVDGVFQLQRFENGFEFRTSFESEWFYTPPLRYVHQLQNAFHSITQHELNDRG